MQGQSEVVSVEGRHEQPGFLFNTIKGKEVAFN